MTHLFETGTCSRCGGGGKYSYCQMYGDTCFKCHGSGKTLTKRGRAAATFLRGLRTVKASEVKFGDCVRVEGMPGMSGTTYVRVDRMATLIDGGSSLQPDGTWKKYSRLEIGGLTPKGQSFGLGTFPNADVTLVPTKAEKAEQVAKALAYQATLTKAGTERKRKT